MQPKQIKLQTFGWLMIVMAALAACAQTAAAAWSGDWYVATNGTGQGTNGWADATNDLQGAINGCAIGKTVLVSNGVYQTGGTLVALSMTNRVYISKAITVRSIDNNPATTIIKGAWHPVTTNGTAAIRCVYMAAGATLSGFTLTNGATIAGSYGGGVYSEAATATISNCVITGCSAANDGGGAYGGTLNNCTIIFNVAFRWGGGIRGGAAFNSTIISNTAPVGGGGYECNMYNCTISYNIGNKPTSNEQNPGGVYGGTSSNCVISYNRGTSWGGGGASVTLYNCLIYGNEASDGGGVYYSTLYNCTVVGNYASHFGGGVANWGPSINIINSIIYSNQAASYPNWAGAGGGSSLSFTDSCTFPTNIVWSAGNTTNYPFFMANGSGYGLTHVPGNYRLQASSPCLNKGLNQNWMTNAVDLDGRTRIRYGTADMGAYEVLYRGTFYGVR